MLLRTLVLALALAAPTTQAATSAPPLDLRVEYYSKAVSPEGVTREVRYAETMLRRPGHVWVMRVLPQQAPAAEHEHSVHKHFNPVLLPRHVQQDGDKTRLEYVDARNKEVIAVPPGEYGNVDFDGSWTNAYYLFDPKLVQAMPLSQRPSAVAGARWREQQRNGSFRRVLWDEQRQIPLRIESGDLAATTFHRVEVQAQANLATALPWQQTKGYAQREYGDFLD
ncbi:hypothetical protein [Pseudoduganella violaceinigra]|uniref:hypothetical protein n=1 Tax=Pseudoduganella violaceinigra TaxID=246602 RepID=UPI00041288E2|nr:hypothetical protein [Pseudoduganella violaceinigra]